MRKLPNWKAPGLDGIQEILADEILCFTQQNNRTHIDECVSSVSILDWDANIYNDTLPMKNKK